MNKFLYPAIFQSEDEGYSVWIPDIQGCISQGDTFEEARENIKDALSVFVLESKKENKDLPKASRAEIIQVVDGQFVVIIELDIVDYLKKKNGGFEEKTLLIPKWLSNLAEAENIELSLILQKALRETLNFQ